MSRVTVTFVQADGVERVFENVRTGQTLMEVGSTAPVDMADTCQVVQQQAEFLVSLNVN